MSEEVLIRHCSPTLAGIKTGNMFTASYANEKELRQDLRSLNRRFAAKGLRIIPLRCKENRALLYLYRPKKLADDLKHCEAKDILEENGYPEDDDWSSDWYFDDSFDDWEEYWDTSSNGCCCCGNCRKR